MPSRTPRSDKEDNFIRRLRETMDSELEPEMITPNTAGCEETEGREVFPLVNVFNQTNMLDRPHHGRRRGNTGLGKDQD
jgi:hypothetical protein